MPYPSPVVQIGTSIGSGSLTLDDPTEGLLDTGTLGDALGYVWSDITADVRASQGVNINRGSTRGQGPYFRYEAGRASFSLDNRTGVYDPFNLGELTSTTSVYGTATYGSGVYGSGTTTVYGTGTYGTGVYGSGGYDVGSVAWTGGSPFTVAGRTLLRPGLPVRISAELNGDTFDLFVGFVDTWGVTYPANAVDSVVNVTAYDAAGMLSAADPNASPAQGAGENAGHRINRVLDNVSWSDTLRTVDTDTADSLQPTTMARSAWTEILLVADSTNGYLFVDRSGAPTFSSKSRFPRRPDMSFGVGGVPVRNLRVSSDADQVYNVVKLARAGGVEQSLEDETSKAENRLRGYARSDLVLDTDDQVMVSVEYVLSQFKDWRLRIEGFEPVLTGESDNGLWVDMLRLDMLTRHSASFMTTDGRNVTDEGLVRGLSLSIRPFDWRWVVSTVRAPQALGQFTLDDLADGVLDASELAAF